MTARTARHERWLLDLTALPTVAGHEHRVVDWVHRWVGRRKDLRLRSDSAGNLLITRTARSRKAPTLLTAHLDHPGFVVTGVDGRTVAWQFLGGVLAPYFEDSSIVLFDEGDGAHRARIVSSAVEGRMRTGTARLAQATGAVRPGSIGRWAFPARSLGVRGGLLHAPGCDDLAGVAAALAALDDLRKRPGTAHVGVLLTRAEEVGFVGAIAACKTTLIPTGARLLCVEMSRSFSDSPIGDGPIVRVGDASSVFDAGLTNQLSHLAATLGKNGFRYQRKLMTGGSCEATAFSAYGFVSSCLCLPLGNYHNMVDIDGVTAGRRPARVGPEFISLSDFHGLVTLLQEAVVDRPTRDLGEELDDHYERWKWVLG